MKITLWGVLFLTHCYAHIALSEIGHNPAGSETASPGGATHEFIELINLSSDTIDLAGSYLTNGTIVDSIVEWKTPLFGLSVEQETTKIPPGKIALILDKEYATAHEISPLPIAEGALLLTVNHTSILGGLTASETITLFYADTFTTPFKPTYTEIGNDDDGASCYPQSLLHPSPTKTYAKATPGELRNHTQQNYYEYSLSDSQEPLFCTLSIFNFSLTGLDISISQREIEMVADEMHETTSIFVFPIDTISAPAILTLNSQKKLIDISDQWIDDKALVISEVNPRGTAEYIELYNRSQHSLSLHNFALLCGEDTIDLPALQLYPKESFLISEVYFAEEVHYRPLSLDNYRDEITLLYKSTPCDTFLWDSYWFTNWPEGFALHRVDMHHVPDSTTLHLAPPSPNQFQDFTDIQNSTVSLTAEPKVLHFGQDSTAITLFAPTGTRATLHLFTMQGTEVLRTEILPNHPYYWDGRTAQGRELPTGPILMLCTYTINNNEGKIRSEVVLWRN